MVVLSRPLTPLLRSDALSCFEWFKAALKLHDLPCVKCQAAEQYLIPANKDSNTI